MEGRYQAYSEYKDSGIEWVGKFPANWTTTRVKFESYVKARVGWHGLKSEDFTDEGPYLVTGSDFKGPRIDWSQCYHCDFKRYEQDPYIQLLNGDLLITKDGTIGKVAIVDNLEDKATLNSGVFVVRPLTGSYTSRFYFWLLQSSVFFGFVDFNKTGSTISHLYQDTFVNFMFAMPSVFEQQQIANFLDHETAKIDTLIEKQQQLIALLGEKRQAVISHAVAKGLNPDAPMRDSGVVWLGEVPEHWDIVQLRRIGRLDQGSAFSHDIQGHKEGEIPWFKVNDMNRLGNEVNMVKADNYVSEDVIDRVKAPIFPEGTVVFPRVGATLLTNKRRILRQPSVVDDNIYCIIPQDISSRYLYLFMLLVDMTRLCSAGLVPTVTFGVIKGLYTPLPSRNEQEEIVLSVERKLEGLDKIAQKSEIAIKLLCERRTALISSAVTGKIDVRNWQPPTDKDIQ